MSDKTPTENPSKETTNKFILECSKNMDSLNKKATEVLVKKGDAEFIKHVFTGDKEHGDAGKPLTYAEMRSRYG